MLPDFLIRTRQYFHAVRGADGTELTVKQEVVSFEKGIQASVTSADIQSAKSVSYDLHGRMKRECDSYGIVTEYEYDDDTDDLNYGIEFNN